MSSNTILPYKMALLSAELRGVIRIIFSALRGLYNYHSHACKVNIQFYMDTHRSTTQIVHVNHCLNCISNHWRLHTAGMGEQECQ